MKTTVNLSDFRDAFRTMGRKENFSYQGLELLFDYFEEYEESGGEEIELDVIALCCDFSEDDYEDIAKNYNIDLSEFEDDDEDGKIEAVGEYLNYNSIVVGRVGNSLVYASF